MPERFIQHADTVDVVKNILDNYPLVEGPICELIQNSDDAGATRQLFVLDRRRHPTTSLYDADYAKYQQSPAMLAYNDAYFRDKDWVSLEKILKSSKTDDSSVFGKFGQGFRCVYHLTDCPQIFSGSSLALLHLLGADQGAKFDMSKEDDAKYTSHLAPFRGIPTVPYPSSSPSSPNIPGTLIRLPLRTQTSPLSNKCPKPDSIITLFNDFIKNDLDHILLFLKNIRQVDIWEIDSDGKTREICCAKLSAESEKRNVSEEYETWKVMVDVHASTTAGTGAGSVGSTRTSKTAWRLLTCPFTDHHSFEELRRLSPNVEEDMKRSKLNQRAALAAPLSSDSDPGSTANYRSWYGGRLFNGLPLPASQAMGWPIHVDARFALNPSRQHLRHSYKESDVNASLEDKWNAVLFKIFIPQAWTFLLHVLARDDHVQDIFQFWPSLGHSGNYGVGGYSTGGVAREMFQTVFNCVIVSKSAVWPIYSSSAVTSSTTTTTTPQATPIPQFAPLAELKVARDDLHIRDLRNMLADCGLQFTLPPQPVRALIEKTAKFEFLTQANTHAGLLQNVSRVEQIISATPKHASLLLDYLLKESDISLLAGLPLLSNVDGHYITLRHLSAPDSNEKQTSYTLLDTLTLPLFAEYDSNAIAVDRLQYATATVIKSKAPGILNVVELDAPKVRDYLATDPRWFPSTDPNSTPQVPVSRETNAWLSKFWQWIGRCTFREELLGMDDVRKFHLLPTHLGLKRLCDPVFDMAISAGLAKCLRALGIGLLDPGLASTAKNVLLSSAGVIKKIGDVRAILEGAIVPSTSGGQALGGSEGTVSGGAQTSLTCTEWKALVEHIARSGLDPEALTEDERRKLRSLPIYPLLDALDKTPVPSPIPDNKIVAGITSIEILPIIEGQVFLDLRGYSPTSYEILRLLEPPNQQHLSSAAPVPIMKLLELGVKNFLSQPPEIRKGIVKYVMTHEKKLPREISERLWEMPFVVGQDGGNRRPWEVVDPMSSIGELLMMIVGVVEGEDEGVFSKYLPRLESDADKEIMENLRKLPVCPLRRTMDQEVLLNITAWISKNKAKEVSRKLLKLLAMSPEYGELVKRIPREHQWITTNLGLKAAHECRDRNAQSALFDEVFPLVEDGIQMTDVLRGILGWTDGLSQQVLFGQLALTLKKGGTYAKVREIVKEIGLYELSETDLEILRGMLEEQAWVPTKKGNLVKLQDAVLEHAVDEAGFLEVSFNEVDYPAVVEFLRKMGVAERPTAEAILDRIKGFGPGPLSNEQITNIFRLLDILPPDLNDALRLQVRLPDVGGIMRPISDLHFNDTGSAADQLPRGLKPIAHPSISESLAQRLCIEPVARELSIFPEYMGESFITSIRNVIRDYSETQMLIEMLANAVDAGATRFVIVVDELPNRNTDLMSSNLSVFQDCPALLVYNDAAFKSEDFKGLYNTGVGSKKQKRDTIGQFGRGALTMFHVTEFPLIISSGYATFIDPSRIHLLSLHSNANIQQIELEKLQHFYPGHLEFLNNMRGLFNLEDISTFSGTIFRLPVRTEQQIQPNSSVSMEPWSAKDLNERILGEFKAKNVARNCFLFTGLESIQAYRRTREDIVEQLWSIEAVTHNPEVEGPYERRMIQITEDQGKQTLWQTVAFTVPGGDMPEFASILIDKYCLRHPRAALAALIRPSEAQHHDYHEHSTLFSTMPLTPRTGLPVQCSAAFIMTNDRRHVRLQLDDDPEHQAKYNAWLLKEVIPPLYLYLLEVLLIAGVPNHHFWPINDSSGDVDQFIIQGLYGPQLGNTKRRVFQSAFNSQKRLSPDEVVILGSPSPIETIVRLLAPGNVAIYSEPFLSRVTDDAELPLMPPHFLKEEILRNPTRITEAFSPTRPDEEPQLSIEDLEGLIDFFTARDPQQLVGLQLLPLEDGSLTTINLSKPHSSDVPTYYAWKQASIPIKIPVNPKRLVKIDFNADLLLDKGFNVEALTSASIASLFEEFLPKNPFIDVSQDDEKQELINDFWDNFQQLRLSIDDFVGFPLVPTLVPGSYASLDACKTHPVAIVPIRAGDLQVCQCLAALGIIVVRPSDDTDPPCPPQLLQILGDKNRFPDSQMKDILRALSCLNTSALLRGFNSLSADDAQYFADWVRRQFLSDIPSELVAIARKLPVWRACNRSGVYEFIPAEELMMLPDAIDENLVVPYIDRQYIAIIPGDLRLTLRSPLAKLGVHVLSFQELLALITPNLPAKMLQQEARADYIELVRVILECSTTDEGLGALLLPNASDFTMTPMKDLYAREDIFLAVFREGSPHFVCAEFRDLEGRLSHLKTLREMDMEIFAVCAQSIANDSDEDGALAAFQVFNNSLPIQLAGLGVNAHRWELVADIDFIPESEARLWRSGEANVNGMGTEGIGLDLSEYRTFPFTGLVSPACIVREDFIAIGWSQRTLPATPLSEAVIRAYPGLGQPSISEVIAHLRVLATQVALDHPNNTAILPDIIATYRYLNQRSAEAGSGLAPLINERLWLNVDDPSQGDIIWQWEAASNLSFDVRDVGNFRAARRFLQEYRTLLVSAGAQQVNHPNSRTGSRGTPGLGLASQVKRKYDEMRKERKLVDVWFIPQDDIPEEPLLGHRSFLAAHSKHLETSFCSGFREAGPASPEKPIPVDMPKEYSRSCVAFVLDYIYTDTIPHATSIAVLLDSLDLAKYWEVVELVDAIQDHIIDEMLVNPDTVDSIQEAAIKQDLTRIISHCEEFCKMNEPYITRFQDNS